MEAGFDSAGDDVFEIKFVVAVDEFVEDLVVVDVLQFCHVGFHDFIVIVSFGLDNVKVFFFMGFLVIFEARFAKEEVFIFLKLVHLVKVGEFVVTLSTVFHIVDDFLYFSIRRRLKN